MYCYTFDLSFICLPLEETDSLLFKKCYFSIFYRKYLNISPFLIELASLVSVKK